MQLIKLFVLIKEIKMRIITGKAKGKKLISPDGYDVTRPTLEVRVV